MNEVEIIDIAGLEARLEPFDWPFASARAAEIDAFWARETAGKPNMFDGRVLLQHAGRIEDGVFRARYFETGYKSFLAWTRMGFPGAAIRNGFAMAALRAADGAFLLGEMGPLTANAGKIYFAAGTPDLDDLLADGTVDLAGSVLRELEEETGLRAADLRIGRAWTVVLDIGRAAFMRDVRLELPAEEARALMLERMKGLPEQELSDIVIIRSKADIVEDTRRMPLFMQRYLAHMFG